jgi:nucleoside-diphosphate-sugar epimerase
LSIKDIADYWVSVCQNGEVVVAGDECRNRERVERFSLNTLHAKKLLGWSPSIDIAEGLLMTKCGNLGGF